MVDFLSTGVFGSVLQIQPQRNLHNSVGLQHRKVFRVKELHLVVSFGLVVESALLERVFVLDSKPDFGLVQDNVRMLVQEVFNPFF